MRFAFIGAIRIIVFMFSVEVVDSEGFVFIIWWLVVIVIVMIVMLGFLVLVLL
jgi:hypothetical protein